MGRLPIELQQMTHPHARIRSSIADASSVDGSPANGALVDNIDKHLNFAIHESSRGRLANMLQYLITFLSLLSVIGKLGNDKARNDKLGNGNLEMEY